MVIGTKAEETRVREGKRTGGVSQKVPRRGRTSDKGRGNKKYSRTLLDSGCGGERGQGTEL